jgi:hypothetical protein
MSNIRDEYRRAKTNRKKATFIATLGGACLIFLGTQSLLGMSMGAAVAALTAWWLYSIRVEALRDIYHIGGR